MEERKKQSAYDFADQLMKIGESENFKNGYNKALDDCIEIVKNNYRMEALNKLEELRK